MASNLRVDTILPSTGTTLGIGTASGTINFLGNSNIVTSGTLNAASATITGNLGVGGTLTYEDVTNIDSVGVITARSTVSIADSIVHTGDTNTSLRFPAADTITAETGGLERIRVDSSGRLGVGANNNDSYDTNARNVLIASSGNTGITIRSGGSSNYAMIHFADGTTGAAQQRAGRIVYEHSTDSLQVSTANTFAFKIDSNGHVTQPNLPSFMAYGNASYTTISSGGNLQPYVFPNTAHNTGTHYNTTSGKFTAPVTGVYQLHWNIFCASPSNQTNAATIEFYVKKNGSTISRLHNKKGYGNMGDDQQVVNLSVIEQLSSGDEIMLFVAAYTVQWRIYGGHTTFSGALIG